MALGPQHRLLVALEAVVLGSLQLWAVVLRRLEEALVAVVLANLQLWVVEHPLLRLDLHRLVVVVLARVAPLAAAALPLRLEAVERHSAPQLLLEAEHLPLRLDLRQLPVAGLAQAPHLAAAAAAERHSEQPLLLAPRVDR